MLRPDEWKSIIQSVLAGTASVADTEAIKSGLLDGRLLFTAGGQSFDAGRDVVGSTIVIGDGNQFHIRLDEERIETLRDRLFSGPTRGLPPPFPSLLFVGRAQVMEDLRARLTQPGDRSLVIVRGWPGVGKTTVMSALGRDDRLLKHFPDEVLWTSLGQTPSLLSALASWGSALGTNTLLRAPTVEAACEHLARLLVDKEMLLMVDDVWDPSHLAPFLAVRGSKCMVVATTREPQVAESFTSTPTLVYPLPVLDDQYAMELFRAIAPEIAALHSRESLDLVRALECLPLAIHVAARLLATESRYGWGVGELIEDLKGGSPLLGRTAPEDRLENGAIPTVAALLKKSTDLLSEQLREYFAYFGVFAPKPATFDLSALRSVWELEDPKPVVRELAGRGLLEPVGPGRFQMHALLVAHARSMLTKE